MKKRVHLFISGRVQGVCFRMEMEIRANRLKVPGFIRNLEDNRVEAVLEGDEEKVDKLVTWAKRGPMFAKVTDIQVIEEEPTEEFNKFKIIY
ncbi:acylphosphatase [Parcubacteria bacterium DG_72]|nr:MAG: acylphosphatase [Parcubacteria bacterium DG_72]